MQGTPTTYCWLLTTSSKTLQSPIARPRLPQRSSLAASNAVCSLLATGYRLLAAARKSFCFRYDFVSRFASIICSAFFAKFLILREGAGGGARNGVKGSRKSFWVVSGHDF